MFAGRRRRSSNIRVMQLFHELKQQFPTVPDHVVSACIAAHAQSPNSLSQQQQQKETIKTILEATAALTSPTTPSTQEPPMGRSPTISQQPPPSSPILPFVESQTSIHQQEQQQQQQQEEATPERNEMNTKSNNDSGDCENVDNNVKIGNSSFYIKRPNHLDLGDKASPRNKWNNTIQLSEKCKDVFKLLNSPNLSDKPPRSPLTPKKPFPKDKKTSPTKSERRLPPAPPPPQQKETTSTPTQTTDTLLGGPLNLSLNVNCSMDLVQSPTSQRRATSIVQLTPMQPWLQETIQSPRSYTSVNLTLRPPSSEPQPPIDITSQNSSLTYSTSSFDSQKGLQSRLQITVGPSGGGVASIRTRPKSCYIAEDETKQLIPLKGSSGGGGSLNNLVDVGKSCVLLRQEARIEKLRIELRTEKAKLIIIRNEVEELEKAKNITTPDKEIEKQLQNEIKHLRWQCEQLALEVDKKEFYRNIYTGPRGPLGRQNRGRLDQEDGPKWNCHLCTFLNHPDLDKCEQCEMPRILHVSAAPGDNIHIHVTPRLSRRIVHSWVL